MSPPPPPPFEPDPRFFPLIFDSISHGIFTTDSLGRISSFNRAAEKLTGFQRQETIGRQCRDVFRSDHCRSICPLRQSIDSGESSEDHEITVLDKTGRSLPLAVSTAALRDREGEIIGGVEMFRDLRLIKELRKHLERSYVFEDIVSKNHRMHRLFEMLPILAQSTSTVLIQGESGTGKELIARAIHSLGPRKDEPFVAVNCSAIPDTLIESELFGYRKGAFTGANRDKPGRFAAAEGGTLLLDEIGELPRELQAKLLRVLQEREYEPLGANERVKADVRILTATNRDLAREVTRRRFRQDLYFRVNVVQIDLPPLRERQEDIPLLVRHFIDRFNAVQGRRIERCSERVLSALMRYPFPGNVRELENTIEHAFVVCFDNIIQIDDLPPRVLEHLAQSRSAAKAPLPLEDAQAEAIREALEQNGHNRTATAKSLSISRNTLWRKMKRYGIE